MPNQVPLVLIGNRVKTTEIASERGYDEGREGEGSQAPYPRSDTLGLLLTVVVHAASIQVRDGAKLVLEQVPERFQSNALIWADGGYAGQLVSWVKENCQRALEIVKRSDKHNGFEVLPHRRARGTNIWLVQSVSSASV